MVEDVFLLTGKQQSWQSPQNHLGLGRWIQQEIDMFADSDLRHSWKPSNLQIKREGNYIAELRTIYVCFLYKASWNP